MTKRWSPTTEHGELSRAVAGHGLAGSVLALPEQPLTDRAFAQVLRDVREQRMTGLLWNAVCSGALPSTRDQAERAEWTHVEVLAGVLSLEHLMLDAVASLDAAGIPTRVLKGPALAHLDYPGAGWRTFGDVDLLVRGDDFERAAQVLASRGHRRRAAEIRPGYDRRFSKGTSFVTDDGLELDLHRTFAAGPFGVRLDVDSLWRASEPFSIGGRSLHALPAEERLVHACYHAVLADGRPRLVPLRDVAQLLLTRTLDVSRVHELVRASRGAAVVARAVRQAWHTLEIADVLVMSAWAQNYRSDDRETADLAVYARGSTRTSRSMASMRALPRWRDRAAFAHALLRPAHEASSGRRR